MKNMTTFALRFMPNDEFNMTTQGSQIQQYETLSSILSGSSLPCAYTHEQMEVSLQAAETDFQNGNFESHLSICERYGV